MAISKRILFVAEDRNPWPEKAVLLFNPFVKKMGLPWTCEGKALDPTINYDRIIHFNLEADFTNPKEECWKITTDADLQREVNDLIAVLLGGTKSQPDAAPTKQTQKEPPKRKLTAKVGRETAGRRGKGVVTIFEISMNDQEIHDLAQKLKTKCGTGGTVKDKRIEIQGDQRDKVIVELEKLGFQVKKVGG
jgi:translation initiation factor 1